MSSTAPAVSRASGVVYCSVECGSCSGDRDMTALTPTTCLDASSVLHAAPGLDLPAHGHAHRCSDRRAHDAWSNVTSLPAICGRGGRVAELCGSYTYPVMHQGKVYRNLFCLLCDVSTRFTYPVIKKTRSL